jgi:hypothetical protein
MPAEWQSKVAEITFDFLKQGHEISLFQNGAATMAALKSLTSYEVECYGHRLYLMGKAEDLSEQTKKPLREFWKAHGSILQGEMKPNYSRRHMINSLVNQSHRMIDEADALVAFVNPNVSMDGIYDVKHALITGKPLLVFPMDMDVRGLPKAEWQSSPKHLGAYMPKSRPRLTERQLKMDYWRWRDLALLEMKLGITIEDNGWFQSPGVRRGRRASAKIYPVNQTGKLQNRWPDQYVDCVCWNDRDPDSEASAQVRLIEDGLQSGGLSHAERKELKRELKMWQHYIRGLDRHGVFDLEAPDSLPKLKPTMQLIYETSPYPGSKPLVWHLNTTVNGIRDPNHKNEPLAGDPMPYDSRPESLSKRLGLRDRDKMAELSQILLDLDATPKMVRKYVAHILSTVRCRIDGLKEMGVKVTVNSAQKMLKEELGTVMEKLRKLQIEVNLANDHESETDYSENYIDIFRDYNDADIFKKVMNLPYDQALGMPESLGYELANEVLKIHLSDRTLKRMSVGKQIRPQNP